MTSHSCHNCVWRLVLALLLALVATTALRACPFCTVESRTLSEELASSDAVVLAKLVAEAEPTPSAATEDGASPDSGTATFEVVEVLRGPDRVAAGGQLKVVYFGENEADKQFMISGIRVEDGSLEWMTPLPLSPTAIEYLRRLPSLPAAGADRLAFFQDYLEHEDPLLAQDAYDEFARAPYAEVKALKDRMHHERLLEWIQSPDVNPSRRRLYLTMLGVCGDERDLPLLEQMIRSDFDAIEPAAAQLVACGLALGGPGVMPAWIETLSLEERRKKLGLDALVACYLTLRGGDGLDLIDARFLKDPDAEYAHIYSTIMALRFHGEEGNVLPRERLLESMRLLLDNADFADQVIPDLARWEDWSVLDRLVAMYKSGDEKNYSRPPIVTYLTVASEQPGDVGERAKAALADLTEFDPEGVKRAQSLMAFGFLARARSTDGASGATRPDGDDPDDKATDAPADLGAFAATAEELAEAEAAEPGDFPDPASFNAAQAEMPDGDEPAATQTPAEPEANEEPARGTGPPPVADLAPPANYSKPLVIGVPLVAAALLALLYWLILRWGAV